ncbi:acetyl-CoA C-acetyltransferase [Sulfitobacter pseudonitzschiae]|uniref:Acetyl-CoA C-acetyltransferase n=1 Tax=Pseudosulfitobacter pseudonitzschiae TaxID=1402135 RepID=A0A9Q2NRC1_9RHOB|nr:acetyl-CoA C-acetyltransferase [Pseudosulfitobacter pseudonitzschiae]MBM2292924.1 acetyl-CoA C-acetyltransferase [Pseudosulfitobacter pseudonitzschiae]MBM2297788.1 acetyl-CoA C-acetyltransferase [Pseudosulfitobacter pseudonitzschiae]MBM2302702.1 acetyl-CoA C-acetyltransferase [Pseudosulfitobacter pseudonitzschiae]MBM2312308.1 acetyl-CoA C-acetyltransferase [Pseudosulfitobacter pseudonitzschiae]MBM2317398.1 acetyl-CoA C-acetyltransferase [Pseudosulfitobacter pseudonitzschiae]
MAEAYIVTTARTAGGRRNGALAGWHPADMGGEVINALVDRAGIDPATVDDVIVGCVTQAGEQAFAFGRNCVLASKLPQSVPAVTIDRQCGSSQQAVQFAAQAVMSGTQDVVIAMGVESMTRVPMFSNVKFHMQEGLGEGPFSDRIAARFGTRDFSQFKGAEMIARKYGFDRETLDCFALESHRRAAKATEAGAFDAEIVPLAVEGGLHRRDEGIRADATLDSIGSVRLLEEGGMITAANASQICDGAAGVLVVSAAALKKYGLTPVARIVNLTVTAGDPVIMLEEPIAATQRALERSGMKIDDIDLYEVNEAFAPIPLAWLKELDADPAKLNVNGGAISLGHPLGASGAKLMTTLVHALHARGLRSGLQTMCEGGGIANVTILEAV